MPHPNSNAITPHRLIAALKRLISPRTPDRRPVSDPQPLHVVQPPVNRISPRLITELRALAKDEPQYISRALRIVTQPELAATQTTTERRMAWLLLREHHHAPPTPVTAA